MGHVCRRAQLRRLAPQSLSGVMMLMRISRRARV
jgi:hypothetical protein